MRISITKENEMAKDNRFNLYIDRSFLQIAQKMYAEPRGISMAAAIKSALEDQMTMAGIPWKEAVARLHAEQATN